MTKAHLTVAKAVPLSVGGSGFQIIYDLKLTGSGYFKYAESKVEIYRDAATDVVCTLCSKVEGKPIRVNDDLFVVVGIFATAEAAREYAKTFEYSLKYYLSKHHFSYNLSWRIKNLAGIEIRSQCSATMSCLQPFSLDSVLPLPDEKIINAIDLLEKAERLSNTELRFFLYVVVLESLLDSEDAKELKEGEIVDAIDSTIEYINSTDVANDTKKFITERLDGLRYTGSRNAVKKVINKYYPNAKISCDGSDKKYISIYNTCYNMRNDFVHNGIIDDRITNYVYAIGKIAYDMVFAIANDRQENTAQSEST